MNVRRSYHCWPSAVDPGRDVEMVIGFYCTSEATNCALLQSLYIKVGIFFYLTETQQE